MLSKKLTRSVIKPAAVGLGLAAASYVTHAGRTWLGYGRAKPARGEDADSLLDVFMNDYEVADRHKIRVAAPAAVALAAATETKLDRCAIVRGIFKGREWILRGKADKVVRPAGLLALVKSLGWGKLAELPDREIVMGAVTKPWEANPFFRALPPDEFAAFSEPGYVKIVWTLRANALGPDKCMFRTETRACATDPISRRKFRRYWSFLSPGIVGIRRMMLPAVKAEAERRWRSAA